jgi:hypothetical protein
MKITNPKINTVVRHTGWRFENDPNYPCDVLITDGQYESNGRVGNFWRWKRILPDGRLSNEEQGYGSFEEAEPLYVVEVKVRKGIKR